LVFIIRIYHDARSSECQINVSYKTAQKSLDIRRKTSNAECQKTLGPLCTELFEMIVGVLTTCHTQYTSDISICIFLFNRTTLQVFVTYLTGALYVHPL